MTPIDAAEAIERWKSRTRLSLVGPKELFKYTTHWGLRILQELRIKLTIPDEANDTFEFFPAVHARDATGATLPVEQLMPEVVFKALEEVIGSPSATVQDQFSRFRADILALDEEVRVSGRPLFEVLNRLFVRWSSRYTGVLCVSTRSECSPMWAHYSQNHAGLVIGLDSVRLLDLPGVWAARPVAYSRRRAKVRAHGNAHGLFKNMLEVLTTKSEEWSHEREWRFLVNRRFANDVQSENGKLTFLPLGSAAAVTRVIFGARCASATVDEGLKTLARPEFRHVKVYRSEPDPESYGTSLVPLNPA